MVDSKRTANIRLKLNKTEQKRFGEILECCRNAYNLSLEYQISQYVENGVLISKFDSIKHLTGMLDRHPELRTAQRHCLNDAVTRANFAMRNHSKMSMKGIADGLPRFRSERRYDSFSYTDGNDFEVLPDMKIRLGKFGTVKYKGQINPFFRRYGIPKTCTIVRSGNGRIEANIVYELKDYNKSTETFRKKTPVGVDVNVKNLATTSDGVVYPNNKRREGIKERIASIQRKMSKYDEGTPKWEKYRVQLAHAFKKLRDAERDVIDKASCELTEEHDFIVFEDIPKKKLVEKTESKQFRRSFASVAWNRLFNKTAYKAEGAGIPVVKVNPAYTSRICSKCGNDVPKTLDQRIHICDRCGSVIDRDVNAAINILNRGLGCRPLSSPG